MLRASTSIAVALANDAKGVVPVESAEDAMTRSKQFEKGEVVLAGEQKMMPISGFGLGNPNASTSESLSRVNGGLYFAAVTVVVATAGSILTARRDA